MERFPRSSKGTMIECITYSGLKQSSNRRRGLLPKSFFSHSWVRGNIITLEYYPATSLARFFSDERRWKCC